MGAKALYLDVVVPGVGEEVAESVPGVHAVDLAAVLGRAAVRQGQRLVRFPAAQPGRYKVHLYTVGYQLGHELNDVLSQPPDDVRRVLPRHHQDFHAVTSLWE